MDYLNVFLVSIGGTATALVVAGFLSKSLLVHLFNKELENYKSALSHDNSVKLENIRAELQRNARAEDRTIAFAQVMKRYEGPLMHAIFDLQSRLYNIIAQGLLGVYYVHGDDSEKEYVVRNTAFVIAQYFAWTEIIRREIQFIDCSDAANTRRLAELRDDIYNLWQTDGIVDLFRVWAGEQRAIGELMIVEEGGRLTCIGYAAFLDKIRKDPDPLFLKLMSQVVSLAESGKHSSPRLREIQHALNDILNYLDPGYTRFPEERRSYVL